jgi:hypothetical protein
MILVPTDELLVKQFLFLNHWKEIAFLEEIL